MSIIKSVELHTTLLTEGPRKTRIQECRIAAHAICMRATMPSLVFIENFLGFQLQDEHNASLKKNMSWIERSPPKHKFRKMF